MARKSEEKSIKDIQRIIETFRDISPELPLQQSLIFIEVALHPDGITFPELVKNLGMPNSSVSRNCNLLATYGERDETGTLVLKGHGVFELNRDIEYRNRTNVKLSVKGKKIIKKMLTRFEAVCNEGGNDDNGGISQG